MTRISEVTRENSDTSVEDNEEAKVKSFAKHMLKSSLFIGTFKEKRFVGPLNSYRDVIKVDDSEEKLMNNLKAVKRRCANYYLKDRWIGITGPRTIGAAAGYNLWVTLEEEVFGRFWYKIKNVEFYHDEVCVKLEVVRPVSVDTTSENNTTSQSFFDGSFDSKKILQMVQKYMRGKLGILFTEVITPSNVKEAIIFMFLLLSTLVTFLVEAVKYLLEYFLKLLHETSNIIKASTPIITAAMKVVTNTINGFYYLIAFVWRTRNRPEINHNVHQRLPIQGHGQNFNNYRALPYSGYNSGYNNQPVYAPRNYSGSSVIITPLD